MKEKQNTSLNAKKNAIPIEIAMIFLLVFGLFINNAYHIVDDDYLDVSESINFINNEFDRATHHAKNGLTMITGMAIINGNSAPDLIISALLPNTTIINNKDSISFNAQIENIGNATFNGNMMIILDYGDESDEITSKMMPNVNIAPGGSTAVNIGRHVYDAGVYEARAVVDPYNQVTELDNDNNARGEDIIVIATTPEIKIDESLNPYKENVTINGIRYQEKDIIIRMNCTYDDCGNVGIYLTEVNDSGRSDVNLPRTMPYSLQYFSPSSWSNVKENDVMIFYAKLKFSGNYNDSFSLSYRINSTYHSFDAPYVLHFTIVKGDYEAPGINIVYPPNNSNISGNASVLQIIISTNESATCRYSDIAEYAFEDGNMMATTDNITHSALVSGLAANTSYEYYFRCSDIWDNVNSEPHMLRFNVENIDNIAPNATIIKPSENQTFENGTRKVEIKVSTDERSGCYISFVNESIFNTGISMNTTDSFNHTYNVSVAMDNVTYLFFIACKDIYGNAMNQTLDSRFNIAAPDPIAPIIKIGNTIYYGDDIVTLRLKFTTDEDAICRYDATNLTYAQMRYNVSSNYSMSHVIEEIFGQSVTGNAYIRCRDRTGNTNTDSAVITYSVKVSSGSSSSGGSSGGGGSSSPESTATSLESIVLEDSQKWEEMKKGEEITFLPTNKEIPLLGIYFNVSQDTRSGVMKVNTYTTKPAGMPEIKDTVYRYMKIATRNIYMNNVKIGFKIEKSISSEQIQSSVKLSRLSGAGWEEMPTKYVQDADQYWYFASDVTDNAPDGYYAITYACIEDWQCPSPWKDCARGQQERECFDANKCDPDKLSKKETQKCKDADKETCSDNIKNQDEEDIDCGGVCPACKNDLLGIWGKVNMEGTMTQDATEKASIMEMPGKAEGIGAGKWMLLILVIIIIGSAGAVGYKYFITYEDISSHDDTLIEYITSRKYQGHEEDDIRKALAQEGWKDEIVAPHMDIVKFVFEKIEVEPDIEKAEDELVKNGWARIKAREIVEKITLLFVIEEIKRNKGITTEEIYNMLITDGYPEEIINKAKAKIHGEGTTGGVVQGLKKQTEAMYEVHK